MNSSSPASSISIEHYTEKLDETTSSSSSTEDPEFDPESDLEDFDNVPVIKREDNADLLPMYTCILSNNSEEVVGVDDLDLLQYDLEKLLSTNALRTRFFLGQYTQEDNDDKKANDNKTWERKMPEYEELKHGVRGSKSGPSKRNEYIYYEDSPKVKVPRYRNFEKFWYTVEPFCAPIGKDNLAFLDTFIKDNAYIDSTIPEVGESFTKSWSDELIDDEEIFCRFGNNKLQNNKNESLESRTTQRLLAARIYDKALEAAEDEAEAAAEAEAEAINTSFSETGKADTKADGFKTTKASEPTCHSDFHDFTIAASLDKRLKKVLVEEGILTKEDAEKCPEDDDIVKEIKKCKEELLIVNERNAVELNKLRSAVVNNIEFNELQNELNTIDKQMLELYNSYVVTNVQDEDKDKEKVFAEPMQPEFASKANALIQQRYVLVSKINDMADTLYYC